MDFVLSSDIPCGGEFLCSTVSILKPDVTAGSRVLFALRAWTVLTEVGDGGNNFAEYAEYELVQDGRFTSSVGADLQYKFR